MPIATVSFPIPLPLLYSYFKQHPWAPQALPAAPTVGCYPIYLCFEAYER